jgi:hypothetical protein
MTPGTRHWGRKWEWLIDQLSHLPERIAGFTLGHLPHVCATAVATAAAWVLARRFLWRWRHIRLADGARVIEIGVPPQVEPQASAALWTHLVGLLRPRWKRLICGQPHLGFEYCADATGVRIQIWVPAAIPPGIVERAVRATWPGASTTSRPATPPVPVSAAAEGGRLLPGRADHFPLACDHDTDPLRGILEAFTGLAPGEHAAVQILARPITGRRAARAHQAAAYLRGGRPAGWRTRLFDTLSPGRHTLAQMPAGELARTHPERAGQVRDILTKATQPRYEVAIRYTAATTKYSHPAAARPWLRTRAHTLAAVYALYTSGNQHLKRRRLRHPARVLAARRLDRGALLSVSELAALAHLPHDITATGITRAGARPTPPPPAIPTGTHSASTTRVLGDADAGHRRPVALPVADGRHHIHILGETGSPTSSSPTPPPDGPPSSSTPKATSTPTSSTGSPGTR